MTEVEIQTLLDVHDALIAAWIDGSLSLATFVASYGEFPRGAGIDEHAAADTRHLLPLFRRRLAFHSQLAAIVAGVSAASSGSMDDQMADFMQIAIGR